MSAHLESAALDVWFRFYPDNEEETEAEANTYLAESGGYVVEWYLTAVGLVKGVWFATLAEAHAWLEGEGFVDYSSGNDCRFCRRQIVFEDGEGWIDPEADGDDRVWRTSCGDNHTELAAPHEPEGWA